jgi:hypothetical protein
MCETDFFSARGCANFRFIYIDRHRGEGGIVLLKAALVLLFIWLVGVLRVYDVGSLVHVPLLVGLMFLMLAFLKARDTAASDQTNSSTSLK